MLPPLVVLLVFLTGTVAIDWSRLQATQRVIYVVLIGLAAFMVARVILAFRLAQQQAGGWETRYMNHIYLTYISLWEGLVIVGLFDLGAPSWLIGAAAIGVLILGAVLYNNYRRRLSSGTVVSLRTRTKSHIGRASSSSSSDS